MRATIRQAGAVLRQATHVVALTGAGISTPSGIPDFRTPHAGLWSQANPMDVASLWSFVDRPVVFYDWFRPLLQRFATAAPNPAHTMLAALEAQGRLVAVITQNIDSLHQAAGSRRVLELHGHTRTATCLACGGCVAAAPLWPMLLAGGPPPLCPTCHGLLKPDVVLFGEPIPYETLRQAQQEALLCDVMLVIGTSLEVMPAADLPLLAQRRGATIILVNRTATDLDGQFDLVIHADVVRALQGIEHSL